MTVRYGIVGCGMMAQEHIRNIALLEGASVRSIVDPNDEMRAQARMTAGNQPAEYTDVRDLAEAGGCDAYVIATPNDTHRRQIVELLTLNKPILVEKPLCTTVSDCRIVQRTNGGGIPVWVAMEYRYMPPLAEMLIELERGAVGQPLMVAVREHRFPFLEKVGDWNRFNQRTGGTFVEKCCHFWDLMRLIVKSDPVRVYASGSHDVNHADEVYDGRVPDMIDNAFAIVEFENGCRGMLDLCMFAEGSYWQETVSVTGSVARIDAMVPAPERFLPGGEQRIPRVEISNRASKLVETRDIPIAPELLCAGDHCGATFYQHEKFLQLVRGQIPLPEVTLDDGSWAVAVGEAAEKSARLGEAVAVSPP